MAVGEATLPELHAVPGVRLATVSAGIKTPGHQDLVLIEVAEKERPEVTLQMHKQTAENESEEELSHESSVQDGAQSVDRR